MKNLTSQIKNPFPAYRFLKAKFKKLTSEDALRVLLFLLIVTSVVILFYTVRADQYRIGQIKTLSQKENQIALLSLRVKNLLKENEVISSEDTRAQLTTVNNVIDKYTTTKAKTADYKNQGVNVASVEASLPQVADLILSKDYNGADGKLNDLNNSLESALKDKQAADAAAAAKKVSPPPPSSTCNSVPTSGYCRLSVSTPVGTFTVDVLAGSVSSVWTDTANSDDCTNNCPTKSLSSYVSGDGGFAGVNGTYFCPPDYSSCAGKVASFDFPVYNSNLHKWVNESHLSWGNNAMMAFGSSGAVFYPAANAYSGLAGLRAGIVNFPGLVNNGANIVGNYSLTSAQYNKGTRGGIATKGNTVYLVVARSATVPDLAEIMVSMGMTHALNLDGGGSSALIYNGSYKVGPGRSLPNAIILK